MQPFTYLDIHTHKTGEAPGCLSIHNLSRDFGRARDAAACSIGLHPWFLSGGGDEFAAMAECAALPNVLAIGECGLDKIRGAAISVQEAAFTRQVALAGAQGKPLIVHCVRAFDEVMQLLQQAKQHVPVIFHGYNKKAAVGRRLLNAGYCLSFGAAVTNAASPAAEMLQQTPADRFFLETDDSPASIREIYTAAARLRNTGEEAIILQVKQNFQNVFKQ